MEIRSGYGTTGTTSTVHTLHPCDSCTLAKVGEQTYFESPQMVNPQILGLIPLLQICKVRCTSPQIADPKIFMNNLQISNP